MKEKLQGLWEGTKKKAQTLFGEPTEEELAGLTPEEQAQYAEEKSQRIPKLLGSLTDTLTGILDANGEKQQRVNDHQKYLREKVWGQPLPDTTINLKQAPYKGMSLTQIPDVDYSPITKFTESDSAQLRQLAERNSKNPLREVNSWADKMQRINYGITPGLGDDPLVVQEGMSEREVSDFGVFTSGPKNRVGLLKRRNDSQAELARSSGDRG